MSKEYIKNNNNTHRKGTHRLPRNSMKWPNLQSTGIDEGKNYQLNKMDEIYTKTIKETFSKLKKHIFIQTQKQQNNKQTRQENP